MRAVNLISTCRFDRVRVEKTVAWREQNMLAALDDYGPRSKQYNKARKQFAVDKSAWHAVLAQRPTQVEGDVWEYTPAYFVAISGRIYLYSCALQACTRELKNAAFYELKDVFNYDLENSQLNGLLLEMRVAGLPCSALETYLATLDAKHIYAKQIGISVGCFKTMLIAIAMCARLPPNAHEWWDAKSAILSALKKEAYETVGYFKSYSEYCRAVGELIRGWLEKFRTLIMPMYNEMQRWVDWLFEVYIPSGKRWDGKKVLSYGGGQLFITNRVGMKLNLSSYGYKRLSDKADPKLRSAVVAFLLQGQEAAYSLTMTTLGPDSGFQTMQNDHDGLVTLGKIPERAKTEAARLSGLTDAKLNPKPDFGVDKDKQCPRYTAILEGH